MTIRAVFFDFDGVLVDSMPAHVRAWKTVLADVGIDMDELAIKLHEGEKAEDTISRLAQDRKLDLSASDLWSLLERKRALYRATAPQGLIAEARQLVDELNARGIECDIVTGSIRANMNGVVSAEEIALFRRIITPDDYRNGKPAPDPYLTALQRSGFAREECLVLENAPLGIQAACAAGLRAIAITTTLSAGYLRQAHRIIERYDELLTEL